MTQRRLLTLGPVGSADDVRRALGQVETSVNRLAEVEAAGLPEKVTALEASDAETDAALIAINNSIEGLNQALLALQASIRPARGTSANTPSSLVSRDGTGSFRAQDIELDGALRVLTEDVTVTDGDVIGTNGDFKATNGNVLALLGDVKSATGQFSAALGYVAGAGGTVTQATNKSTGVTLNKRCGEITLNSASLPANSGIQFLLTNSTVSPSTNMILQHVSGGSVGSYVVGGACGAGSAVITVWNLSAAALAEAIVLRFTVLGSVSV